jgi:hypothetical protein
MPPRDSPLPAAIVALTSSGASIGWSHTALLPRSLRLCTTWRGPRTGLPDLFDKTICP